MTSRTRNNYTNSGFGFGDVLQNAWNRSRKSISLLIVAVCVTLFVGVAAFDVFHIVSRSITISYLGLSYIGVFEHYWLYQFLTAPLLHANISHLLFNMLSLWMLGPGIEKTLGRRRYIFFSLLCAICSMIGFLLFSWGKGNIVLGYSGVVFGILVAQAIFFPDNTIFLFAFFPLKMKHAVLLLGAVELYLTISPQVGGIANVAHLFGAVAAFVYLKGAHFWQAQLKRMRAKLKYRLIKKSVFKKNRQDIPWEL